MRIENLQRDGVDVVLAEPLPSESPFVEWVNAAVDEAERDGGQA